MMKEVSVIPLFEKFIKETYSGKRRKANGEKILPQSIMNYEFAVRLLRQYEEERGETIRVVTNIKYNRRKILQEQKYWKDFYRSFSDFLHYKKKIP